MGGGFSIGWAVFFSLLTVGFLGLFGIGRHRVIFAFSTSHQFTVVKSNFNCSFHRVLLCLLINFSLSFLKLDKLFFIDMSKFLFICLNLFFLIMKALFRLN